MNKLNYFSFVLALISLSIGRGFSVLRTAAAQSALDKVLVLNGKTIGGAKIRQIDGHPYVDIEALAEAIEGTVTIEHDQVILTIPVQESGASRDATPFSRGQRLSKDFASAAVAEMAEMKGWQGAIEAMVTYGLAASVAWAQEYRERVNQALRQTMLAASTDGDQNALQLLKTESNSLAGWAEEVLAARQVLNGAKTVDPNALQNDLVLAKVARCGRFLDAMLVSGVFSDDGSCH